MDALFYDKGLDGTGNHNDNWFNTSNGFLIARGNDGTTLTHNRSSGWCTIFPNQSSSSSYPFSIGTCIEFDILDYHNNMRFQLYDGTTARYQFFIQTTGHYKITVNQTNIIREVNGNSTSYTRSDYINSDFNICFATDVLQEALKYANFVVYPI